MAKQLRIVLVNDEVAIAALAIREYMAKHDAYTANGVAPSKECKLFDKLFNKLLNFESENDPYYEAYVNGGKRQ